MDAERLFREILEGFLRNAAKTSKSLAVCEFPDATITESFKAASGLSTTAVCRMMPAMAAWVKGTGDRKLLETVATIYRNAFDPANPDYWLPSPDGKQNQRQVESSIVAWSLWLLREELLPLLGERGRRNAAEWLEGCTRVPVRGNNWAWFTAVNQAARLALAPSWPEFQGQEAFMIDDLKALDAMAAGEGWYNDGLTGHGFDYYNSWVFASHFLYWDEIIGRRYPEWSRRFAQRLDAWLKTFPHFFAANGSHVLYGRSLIYRWAVVTPLVLAYRQQRWPHSPGLLKRIVRGNLEYFWSIGAFDSDRGKLRESLSAEGTTRIRETYIDGGHPYWGMQAFAMFLIPPGDPFWTRSEEPLPVERADFQLPLKGPGLLVAGSKASGHLRLIQARSTRDDPHYRDKYNKLAYSSHFPFCVNWEKTRGGWDNSLVLWDATTGETITRGVIESSEVTRDRVEIVYPLGPMRVRTRVIVDGEFEGRVHHIESVASLSGWVFREGSYPLGLSGGDRVKQSAAGGTIQASNPRTTHLVAVWRLAGWQLLEGFTGTGDSVVYPRYVIPTLTAEISPDRRILASVHYASPRPLRDKDVADGAARMRTRLGL